MPSFNFSYTYDGVGNRLTKTDNLTSEVTTYTYDAANRLLTETDSSGTTTYTYDADGNRIKKETPSGTTFYGWDENNRMIEAEPPSGTITMSYNADGKRVRKETPTSATKYIYDFEKLLQETDDNDDTQRLFTATLEEYGDLVSEFDGAASSYHQYDALGSTDALLDADETVTDRYRYTAFGLQHHQSGSSASPFTFVGRQNYYRDDEIDLYLAGLRHYDPAIGQWVSDDPIGFGGGDVNLRRYVRNDPLSVVDPSGLVDWLENYWNNSVVPFLDQAGERTGDAILYTYFPYAGPYFAAKDAIESSKQLVENREEAARTLVGESVKDIVRPYGPFGLILEAQSFQKSAFPENEREALEAQQEARGRFDKTVAAFLLSRVPPSKRCIPPAQTSSGWSLVREWFRRVKNTKSGADSTKNVPEPNRIYSARELVRRAEEPGPFHNFPESFNADIFKGKRTVVSSDYVVYSKPGSITLPGKPIYDATCKRIGEGPARLVEGTFEIGVRRSTSGRNETIVHRFFRPN